MKNTFEPYFTIVEMRRNTYLFDLDHIDFKDISKLNEFLLKYSVKASLIDTCGLWTDFMTFKLDCTSCTVNENYFDEFYSWLLDTENKEQ